MAANRTIADRALSIGEGVSGNAIFWAVLQLLGLGGGKRHGVSANCQLERPHARRVPPAGQEELNAQVRARVELRRLA